MLIYSNISILSLYDLDFGITTILQQDIFIKIGEENKITFSKNMRNKIKKK